MALRTLAIVVGLLPFLLAAGCAKRPAMTSAAAPPPTGAVIAAPAAPPALIVPRPAAPPAVTPPPAPAPPRPAPAEFASIPELRDIFFDFDKYALRPEAARTLDANIDWLKSHPSAPVLVEGHCDERGTNAYNIALGERRARAARDYLVAHGVAAARIVTISYGEERPACTARNEACWARNRRAHFLTKVP